MDLSDDFADADPSAHRFFEALEGSLRGELDPTTAEPASDHSHLPRMPDNTDVDRLGDIALTAANARTTMRGEWLDDGALSYMFTVLQTYISVLYSCQISVIPASIFGGPLCEDVRSWNDHGLPNVLGHVEVRSRDQIRVAISTYFSLQTDSVLVVPINDAYLSRREHVRQGLPDTGVQEGGGHWLAAVVIGPDAAFRSRILRRNLNSFHRRGRWTVVWLDSLKDNTHAQALLSFLYDAMAIVAAVERTQIDLYIPVCPLQQDGCNCGPLSVFNTSLLFHGSLQSLATLLPDAGVLARRVIQAVLAPAWNAVATAQGCRTFEEENRPERTGSSPVAVPAHDARVDGDRTRKATSPPESGPRQKRTRTGRADNRKNDASHRRENEETERPATTRSGTGRKVVEVDRTYKVWYGEAQGLTIDRLIAHFRALEDYQHLRGHYKGGGGAARQQQTRQGEGKRASRRLGTLTGEGMIAFRTQAGAEACVNTEHVIEGKRIAVRIARHQDATFAFPNTARVELVLAQSRPGWRTVIIRDVGADTELLRFATQQQRRFGPITAAFVKNSGHRRDVTLRFERRNDAATCIAAFVGEEGDQATWYDLDDEGSSQMDPHAPSDEE